MEEEMQPLAALVEPMVWVYAEDVYRQDQELPHFETIISGFHFFSGNDF